MFTFLGAFLHTVSDNIKISKIPLHVLVLDSVALIMDSLETFYGQTFNEPLSHTSHNCGRLGIAPERDWEHLELLVKHDRIQVECNNSFAAKSRGT